MHEITEKFKIPDLSPSSYMKAAEMIRDDPDYATMYLRNRYSYSNPKLDVECTGHCQKSRFCGTANAMEKDKKACYGKPEIDFVNDFEDAILAMLFNIWFEKQD